MGLKVFVAIVLATAALAMEDPTPKIIIKRISENSVDVDGLIGDDALSDPDFDVPEYEDSDKQDETSTVSVDEGVESSSDDIAYHGSDSEGVDEDNEEGWCPLEPAPLTGSICVDRSLEVDDMYVFDTTDGSIHGHSWMNDIIHAQPGFANLKLNEIFMMGSHDAQSYPSGYQSTRKSNNYPVRKAKYLKSVSPSLFSGFTFLKTVAGSVSKEYVYKWGVAQGVNLYRQMKQGLRFFDLRIYYDPKTRTFGTHHGLRNGSLRSLVEQAIQFLDDYPTEIVFLRFKFESTVDKKLLGSMNKAARKALLAIRGRTYHPSFDRRRQPNGTPRRNLGDVTLADIRNAPGNRRLVIVAAKFPALDFVMSRAWKESQVKAGEATQMCCSTWVQLVAQDHVLMDIHNDRLAAYADREEIDPRMTFSYMTMTGHPKFDVEMEAFRTLKHVTEMFWNEGGLRELRKRLLPADITRRSKLQSLYERVNVLMCDWMSVALFQLSIETNLQRAQAAAAGFHLSVPTGRPIHHANRNLYGCHIHFRNLPCPTDRQADAMYRPFLKALAKGRIGITRKSKKNYNAKKNFSSTKKVIAVAAQVQRALAKKNKKVAQQNLKAYTKRLKREFPQFI